MKRLLLFVTLLMSSSAYADSRQLLCEGGINLLLNPTQKTVHHIQKNGDAVKLEVTNFEKLRGGRDTYRIAATILVQGNNEPISIVTVWRPDPPLRALVSLGDKESAQLTCNPVVYPDLP